MQMISKHGKERAIAEIEMVIFGLGVSEIKNTDWVDNPELALLVHASRSLEVAVYNLKRALKYGSK